MVIRECAVMKIIKPCGEVYEKHLFSDRDIHIWRVACMQLGCHVESIEVVEVVEGDYL